MHHHSVCGWHRISALYIDAFSPAVCTSRLKNDSLCNTICIGRGWGVSKLSNTLLCWMIVWWFHYKFIFAPQFRHLHLNSDICTSIPTSHNHWWPLIIAYDPVTISSLHLNSDICTSILTFGQTPQKWPLLAPKKGNNMAKKKTSPESILVWTFCKKTDPNWSNLAPGAQFTFYRAI